MAGLRCRFESRLVDRGWATNDSGAVPLRDPPPDALGARVVGAGNAFAGGPSAPTRILCLGNSLILEDRAGWLVYDRLARGVLPSGVQVIDAGLAGLGLLGHFEEAGRVILVDATSGLSDPGQVTLYDCTVALGRAEGVHYGHDGGLPYLLGALPAVLERLPAEILLVGLEPPVGEAAVEKAVSLCLALVKGEKIHACQPLCW